MRVGYHVKHGKSLLAEMERASSIISEFGFKPYIQIFVCGPMNHVMVNIPDDEIEGIRRIQHVIHSAYVSYPWNNAKGTIHNLGLEFKMARRLASDGVIVHMGAGIYDDAILTSVKNHTIDNKFDKYGKLGNKLDNKLDTLLWLEIAACKPSSPNAFSSPSEINKALSLIGKQAGLVIDTAHLWSLGVSFAGYDETTNWLSGLERTDHIIFHLNDSLDTLGGGRDVHAACGKGNIWGKFCKKGASYRCSNLAESGLVAVLKWAKLHDSPIILERGDDVRNELAFLASLVV
jgi:endonuclease IV